MSAAPDPWGDDLMAIVDATREQPIHPSMRGVEHMPDELLAAVVDDWTADQPIPYWPTMHETCDGCGIGICSCRPEPCSEHHTTACVHDGRLLCPDCCGPEGGAS